MIRNILVKSLYEKLQGPEFGPEEEVEFPFVKYVVGILSTSFIPKKPIEPGPDSFTRDDPEFTSSPGIKDKKGIYHPIKKTDSFESFEGDDSFHESSLDPREGSKSMGVSFLVSSSGTPKISICCTWARYEPKSGYDRYEYGLFNRIPNYFVTNEIEISDENDEKLNLFSESSFSEKFVSRDGAILHIRKRKNIQNNWTVSVFLENHTIFNEKIDKRERDEHRIFQPQIRIVCSNNTSTDFFEQSLTPKPNSSDAKDMLAHMGRSSKARGHQCGAVWKDVDPEKELSSFSKCMWTETNNDKFPQSIKNKFTFPHIRTDYFPSYTILQPDLSDKPEFDAEKLSEMWTEEEFKNDSDNGLKKIHSSYFDWISDQKNKLDTLSLHKNLHLTAKTNLSLCDDSLNRINDGIEFICKDERAKLAFCFMNKVMAKKMNWDNRDEKNFSGLRWREFQMAFMLQSLRGVAGIDKDESKTCEVLWFPTGGGKTEAYLGLSIFAIAYRRLSHVPDYENDGGTSILSRYTLRLLTIQQFTRACGSTLAADVLRVENWRPNKITKFNDPQLEESFISKHLWGRSRISIGLWIGGGITPNRFNLYESWKGDCSRNATGSLAPHLIDDNPTCKNIKNSGEPAQISNCPCCGNTLATHSLKKNISTRITWLIKTSKTLSELTVLKDEDFAPSNSFLKIENVQFDMAENTFSKDDPHMWFSANVLIRNDEPDSLINNWWKNVVVDKISNSGSELLKSTSAARPGYFFIENSNGDPFDYSIHCTNFKNCDLNDKGTKWFENQLDKMSASVAPEFKDPNDNHYSTSIPISAFTVDDQIYAKCPTFLIATADKFARIPFDLRSASIFGNVDVFHHTYGYGRDGRDDVERKHIYRTPLDTEKKPLRLDPSDFSKVLPFSPPNLIIQDELHLIEGPLGSMVGIYEMAVDLLCTNQHQSPKYIASSATIKESKSQVASVYRREINIFPQPAISSTDTHFTKVKDDICSTDSGSGRLYLGICAGVGTYTIPVKIWAVLLSKIFQIRNDPKNKEYGLEEKFSKQKESLLKKGISFESFVDRETDLYWTLVGFFSDLELLARTSSFYLDDIYRDVRSFSSQILQNIDVRGLGEKKSKGIRFYKITPSDLFTASAVSLFCQKDGGNASVAVFDDDDGKPGTLQTLCIKNNHIITCTKGENYLELENSISLKKNIPVWICVMVDSDLCNFQTGENPDSCYTSTSFVQKQEKGKMIDVLGDFSNATLNMVKKDELPIRLALKSNFRDLDYNRKIEMSSQTPATDLPGILDRLDKIPNDIDALLTTPIFGTGIDINRLGLMVVMNQPKTTSQYIQATGRVGRSGPGLVVSWLKSGRYRDLNHFENFIGYHRTIHRFVEPITASPFSEKTMRLYLGPVIVAALRAGKSFNGNTVPVGWVPTINGKFVLQNKNNPEIDSISDLMKNLACSTLIPEIRRLSSTFFEEYFDSAMKKWELAAKSTKDKTDLHYYDYSYMYSSDVKHDVVLGSAAHKIQKKKIAFQNTKTSLREIESQAVFGEQLVE